MKVEWNNCFLCLNDLTGQGSDSEDNGGRNRKRKKKGRKEKTSVSKNCSGQTSLFINYLLTDKSGKHSGVISNIKQLLERKGDVCSPVKFCENCEGQLRSVSELHRELEVVQMKLVSVLKAVKKTVLQNSNKGGGSGNVGLEIFEQWLREQESNYAAEEGNEEEKARLKEQRRILETLVAFQDAVIENYKDSIEIPMVILERCTAFRTQPCEKVPYAPEAIIKTEVPDLEDFLDTPMSPPGHEDFDLAPVPEAPKPKRKKRTPRTNVEIKREVLRPPRASTSTARLKMIEIKNSYLRKKKELPPNKPPPRKNFPVPPSFHRKPHSILRKVPRHTFNLLYCCALCPFTHRSLYSLQEHLQNHETEVASQQNPPPTQFQCDLCPDLRFHLEQSSEFHKLTHNGHYAILCDLCNTWQPPLTFKDHMTSHLEKTFPCPNCSFCTTTRDKYIYHLSLHHLNSSILECDLCGVRSSGKRKFLEHYFEVHQAIEKLVCGVDGCTKEFLSQDGLASHKVAHTDKFRCSHCDRSYSCRQHLEEHLAKVKGEKPWKCDQCENSFSKKDVLDRHKIKAHGAPRLKCDLCEKTFTDRPQLNIHRRLHTGEGVTCEHPGCGKVYASKAKQKVHMILHSTERNFVCDQCGIALKSKQQLRKHKLTHAGEEAKKHECPQCGKRFLLDQYLVVHLKIHTGERPYICEACGKGFNQSATLHNHKKKCFLGPAPPVIQKRDERAKPIKIKSPLEDSIN